MSKVGTAQLAMKGLLEDLNSLSVIYLDNVPPNVSAQGPYAILSVSLSRGFDSDIEQMNEQSWAATIEIHARRDERAMDSSNEDAPNEALFQAVEDCITVFDTEAAVTELRNATDDFVDCKFAGADMGESGEVALVHYVLRLRYQYASS